MDGRVKPGHDDVVLVFDRYAGAKWTLRRLRLVMHIHSLAIDSIAYDEKAHRLRARFRDSGTVVTYDDVPQEVYDSLIFADSIGQFFRDHIQGRFPETHH